MNDLHTSVAMTTQGHDNPPRDTQSHLETRVLHSSSVSPSESSSVLHNTDSKIDVSSSLSIDSLPRPCPHIQETTLEIETDRQLPSDSSRTELSERRDTASFDTDHVFEDDAAVMRQQALDNSHDTRDNGDAVGFRLLQAMPQLGIGQLLQDFTNQIPPWRGFATGSNHDVEELNETGRLLSNEEVEEGRGLHHSSHHRRRRRLSSDTSMYSLSSLNGDLEETEQGSVAENETVATATLPSSGDADDSTRGRRNSEEESDDQTTMDEVQALFRRCHNSLPFIALFLIYFAYQHATGILVFVVGTVAVMGLDQRMRAQIALKDKANTWHLLGIVTMCAIDMVAICSVEGGLNPFHRFSQIFRSKTAHGSDSGSELLSTGGIFWQVLWTVLVNDFLVRLWSVVVKAFVAGAKSDRFQCERKFRDEATTNADESPAIVIPDEETGGGATTVAPYTQQAVSTVAFYRRKRKLYGIIEMCSIFLRSLLASIPWCRFYQLCASKFMADVFTFAYLVIKGLILANQGRRIFILARSFVTLGLEFGVYVSHDELVEAGSPDCSICYESMKQPVKLACSHMFCEECVTEWFDHERSCPLCRASVESSGATDAENVKPEFLDGRTSLVPQLL